MNKPLEEKLSLVKQLKYDYAGVPAIHAKIYEVLFSSVQGRKYKWEINYYNQLSDDTEPYMPGTASTYFNNQADAEEGLEKYCERFPDSVKWKANGGF